jgi:tetratricopeptide (TPR) repeat protein
MYNRYEGEYNKRKIFLQGGLIVFFHQFDIVFDSLKEIEDDFKHNPGEEEIEELTGKLLNLRNIMDECVKCWLNFEERVNELQKKYNFTLPDLLPDDFLHGLNLNREQQLGEKQSRENRIGSSGTIKSKKPTLFFQLESEQGISSFRKGMGFWDLAMLEEAIREFEKLVALEPNYIFGHFCLGLAYSQKGFNEKALAKLRLVKALSQDKQLKALVHNAMGNIYVSEQKYDEALNEFSSAVEENSLFFTGYFNMGAVLYNMHRYKEACAAFEKAKEISPQDWEICYYLGKTYALLGEFKKGLQNFKLAFSLNPAETKILFELGVVYDLLGDKRNASFYYNRVLNEQR